MLFVVVVVAVDVFVVVDGRDTGHSPSPSIHRPYMNFCDKKIVHVFLFFS